jgi:hypothetical protein
MEKDKQFREMRLLIEWGQTSLVRDMLDELGGRRAWCWRSAVTKNEDATAAIVLQRSFLNDALHLTLVHNNFEMARLFLARGADASSYAKARGYRELLTEAYDPEKNRHLLGLLQAGWVFPSALAALAGEKDARDKMISHSEAHVPESFLHAVSGAYEACCSDSGSKFQCNLRDVTDDLQAQAILRRVYSNLVHDDSGGPAALSCPRSLHFSSGGDFDAFLLLLFLGRFELAKLFWERDGRNNPSAFLQSALLACIVCSRIAASPDIRSHQRDSLRQAKIDFEIIAASILQVSTQQPLAHLPVPLAASHLLWIPLLCPAALDPALTLTRFLRSSIAIPTFYF